MRYQIFMNVRTVSYTHLDVYKRQISGKKIVKTDISSQVFNIFKYANSIVEKNYLVVGNYIRKNIQQEVVWFYDINTCVDFLYRIKKIILDDEKTKILITKGILKIENILCVYENCIDKDELLIKLEGMSGVNYNMYLMINGIQIGSSDKQICNLSLIHISLEKLE